MGTFFHITEGRFLDAILAEGLKPAIETGNSDPTASGAMSDPNYIHVWKREALPRGALEKRPSMRILRVSLPADFPLERDYAEFTFFLQLDDRELEALATIVPSLKSRRGYLVNKFACLGVDFQGDISDENIRAHIDHISQQTWDATSSAYRTKQSIPPHRVKYIR